MAKRPRIGVDLDDVLFDLMQQLIDFHNTEYGTELGLPDVRYFNEIERVFGCTVAQKNERIRHFYESAMHDATRPVAGAPEAITLLAQTHSLHIVTARPSWMSQKTVALLSRHFEPVFATMDFTGFYLEAPERRRTKADVCNDHGLGIFVDDALHNAVDIAAIGCTVLMPDKPWNQGELPPNVYRIFGGWPEITEHILNAAQTAA